MALVEGGLRLHHRDRALGGGDDHVDEALEALRGVAEAPLLEQPPGGIEAEDEWAVDVSEPREPSGEPGCATGFSRPPSHERKDRSAVHIAHGLGDAMAWSVL
jgi:hypothetical protein